MGYTYYPSGDLNTLNHNLAAGANSPHYTFGYTAAHELESEDVNKPAFVWQPSAAGTSTYAAANSLN